MSEKADLVHQIGGTILRRANHEGDAWDYAGWAFETQDGQNYGGEIFRFKGDQRLYISLGAEQRSAGQAMFRFREITKGDDGKPWIKCLIAVRKKDKALKILFEFLDESRWKITPQNTERARNILLGDAFSEIQQGPAG